MSTRATWAHGPFFHLYHDYADEAVHLELNGVDFDVVVRGGQRKASTVTVQLPRYVLEGFAAVDWKRLLEIEEGA